MNKKQKKIAVEAGMGLAAITAATAAGVYFLSGKKGAKNRKKVKGWMLKAKGEVLQEMEHMKNMSEGRYKDTIDAMAERYKILKSVDQKELDHLVKELKGHWKNIKKDLSSKRISAKSGKVKTKKVSKQKIK
jgi:hypothetical protein